MTMKYFEGTSASEKHKGVEDGWDYCASFLRHENYDVLHRGKNEEDVVMEAAMVTTM